MFLLMLRCGLRVEEVSNLRLAAIDFKRRRILIQHGKGAKDRVVCASNDALKALVDYLKVRPSSRARKLFLVEKGSYRGKPISVRGIKKRIEYYAKKHGLKVSCHQLRHTFGRHLVEAGMRVTSIQQLMGHSRIRTTQIYLHISDRQVQDDYDAAMVEIDRRLLLGGGAQ